MSDLEETNRIRIAAGLKPIPVPGEEGAGGGSADMQVDEDPDIVAQRNYTERVEQERKEKEAQEIRDRIAKAKNQRALNAKLKGSTLGAAEEEEDDAVAWIKKSKKKQKAIKKELELAKQREEEQKEQELAAVYGADQLRGLKVAHDTKDIDAGSEMILTLKDSRILGDDEDELQNVDLADEERRRAANIRKKRAKEGYTGYDDDEFDPDGGNELIGTRDVLSKYDDEYAGEGLKREGFRLGATPPPEAKRQKRENGPGLGMGIIDDDDLPQDMSSRVNRELLNLDYAKNFEVSDYMTEDTTFKKKKRKTKRNSRKADVGAEEEVEGATNGDVEMNSEEKSAVKQLDRTLQDNLVDDDELALALSRSRKQATMKRSKRMRPEDIAQQVADREEAAEAEPETVDVGEGLTFDDTSEFVRNVTLDSLVKREPRVKVEPESLVPELPHNVTVKQEPGEEPEIRVKIETTDDGEPLGGLEMDTAAQDVPMEDGELSEEDDDLAEMALRQGLSLEEMRLKLDSELQVKEETKEDVMISKPEPTVAGGMAGVLALLRQQGALKETTREDKERERIQKEKDLWLADHRRRIAKRELERAKLRGGAVRDQAQREWEIKTREQQEARDALQAYASYKPEVKIEYTDEFGRVMTPLEAWKSLSHKFHGKTSGRRKTELRLRRIEEERKREAMTAGDTPSGMLQAFTRRQEATGEAYMTLSLGNKNYVPTGDVRTKNGIVTPGGKSAQASSSKAGGKKANQSGPKVLG